MELERYAALREKYPLPAQMESEGHAVDKKTGHVLAVGIKTHRRLYWEAGYTCDVGAPMELHACACALMELIQGMAVIKTILLTPEMVYRPVCKGDKPTKELIYFSQMALCALNQAFQGYLGELAEG